MADIARMAGVDTSTVSRALSGSDRVTTETRTRIEEIVRDTGYVINKTARNLRDGRAGQVLVIIPELSSKSYPEMVQGIIGEFGEREINVLLGATQREPKREAELGRRLMTGVVDGIITITGSVPETILDMPGFERKVVALARPVAQPGVPWITIDNHAATMAVMRHLFDMGHRRIAHIGGILASETFRARSAAYVDFMRGSGLSEWVTVRPTDYFDAEAGITVMRSLLEDGRRPTAVFCATDDLAIGAMAVTREAGLAIPDEVSFFGFDDLEMAKLMYPRLSTVSVPRIEMGRSGARTLFERIYENAASPEKIVLPHRLVLRDSVARIG